MSNETLGKWCAVAAVLVLIVGFYPRGEANEDGRRAFMKECQDDNLKHYQCVSLWNGAGLAVFRGRDMLPLDAN